MPRRKRLAVLIAVASAPLAHAGGKPVNVPNQDGLKVRSRYFLSHFSACFVSFSSMRGPIVAEGALRHLDCINAQRPTYTYLF
jgi:hypothetical protein